MKEKNNPGNIDFYALFFRYFIYWPWFLVSIGLCLAATYLYLQYQTPMYSIRSAVLIKEQENKQQGNNPTLSAIQDLGMMTLTNNFDNELQILKSQTLVRKVVDDLGLYISQTEDRSFGYDLPLYRNEPVKVYMNPDEAAQLESLVTLRMDYVPQQPLTVEMTYLDKVTEHVFQKFPAVLPTDAGVITFTPDTTSHGKRPIKLIVFINNPNNSASTYSAHMQVEPISKTTTIAQISVQNEVKQRGIDFIYQLVKIYNQDANDEKNEVAQKTAEFIEERIAIIDKELGSTENTLADFKQRARLTDLQSDAQMALQETSRYEQQLTQNATQINLIQDLADYIQNPLHALEVIPAHVGIQDPNLAQVINQYNTLIVERKRLLRTSSESNPAVVNLNSGIDAMRTTVLTSVNSALRGLRMEEKNLRREARKHEGRISDAPTQEKEYLSLARQQEIKANLYTMLLQKREENAITLASTASNGRIIEIPMAGKNPVSPPTKAYMMAALLVGILLPTAGIYLKELLQYQIENRSDVEKITDVPVLAELPKSDMSQCLQGSIVIHENKNNLMEEAFRMLRTNLLFLLEGNQKVVLITSSRPGEGRSFVSGNLAVSLAYLGKKVVIVGLDIRKSGLNKVFGINSHLPGITDYLSQPEEHKLTDLILPSGISPNLDILPRGSIPPNPTELIARPALEKAIEELKKQYDLILLDTAPVAMVTDTSLISRVANIGIYICRSDYTPKAAFQYINTWRQHTALKLATVINCIDLSKRKNSVHLNYGYKYGYGRNYGYGYEKETGLR